MNFSASVPHLRSFAVLAPLAAGLCVGAVGCRVGPNYAPPDLTHRSGAAWTDATSEKSPDAGGPGKAEGETGVIGPADAATLATWWRSFEDSELTSLVERAFEGNLDLVEARERVIAARARRGIENAARLPSLDAETSYRRTQSGREATSLGGGPAGEETDVYALGVVAGWEVDLWGRVGRLVEARDAEIAFAIEDFRAARVALAAELAREVILVRSLDERTRVVERTIALNQQSVEIAESRVRGGLASELDLVRARRTLATDRALLPELAGQRRAAEHRAAVLLGLRPGELAIARASLPEPPSLPALGLPAELVTRRPDIRRAERQLAAATARIGAAEAERYPRVSLSGTFSLSSDTPGGVLDSDAGVLSAGPTITLPLFRGGAIDANIEAANSEARQALTRVESSVLGAVREVETALALHRQARRRVVELQDAATQARDAERLATSLYASGRTDFINVIDAQSQLLLIDERLVLTRQGRLERIIDLYAALGGGWEPQPETALANKAAQP
ncbi:MAG: efflux transporter outer membrane subunit [Planctomycetota bacterium]|nr:efflux transporter outer membrane subunit [Planctomycetota bacterium]